MSRNSQNINQIYGSARLGSLKTKVDVFGSAYEDYFDEITTHAIGDRNFNDTWFSCKESLSGINPDWSHSGISGVLTVVSDKLLPKFESSAPTVVSGFSADLVVSCDYSPFGVTLAGRGVEGNYRYRFQGQEMDDEIKGEGNSVNYKYRMHCLSRHFGNPRVGRFFAVDPLAAKYPHNSAYAFSENRVIASIELEGLEAVDLSDGTQVHTGPVTLEKQLEIVENSGCYNDDVYIIGGLAEGCMIVKPVEVTPNNDLSCPIQITESAFDAQENYEFEAQWALNFFGSNYIGNINPKNAEGYVYNVRPQDLADGIPRYRANPFACVNVLIPVSQDF